MPSLRLNSNDKHSDTVDRNFVHSRSMSFRSIIAHGLIKVTSAFYILLSLSTLSAQTSDPSFQYLTAEQGLSNNWVKTILQDDQGFMWFGTFNGLCRFDGQDVITYHASPDSHTLNDNIIEDLIQDDDGSLWIGTFSGGLSCMKKETQQFTTYSHEESDLSTLGSNHVHALFIDATEQLWIGHDKGLDRYDHTSHHFHHYAVSEEEGGNSVLDILDLDSTHLLIATERGLYTLDKTTDGISSFILKTPPCRLSTSIKTLYRDRYGYLWIGSMNDGLYRYSPIDSSCVHYVGFGQSMRNTSSAILSITNDWEGRLWVATEGDGIHIYDYKTNSFHRLYPDYTKPHGLNSHSIHALCYDDASGMLWLGTYNGGVNFTSRWQKPFMSLSSGPGRLNNNHVTSIAETEEGRLWIGTDGGGLTLCDERLRDFSYITAQNQQSEGLINNAVLTILCDKNNRIWVGTFDGGLNLFSAEGQWMKSFLPDTQIQGSLRDGSISALYEDRQGRLWVGTMNAGLHLYEEPHDGFKNYQHRPGDEHSLLDNFIYGIYETKEAQLLVLTGRGVAQFDPKTERFEQYEALRYVNIGVPTVILEDGRQNLWIGSQENGLFALNQGTHDIRQFTTADGLPNNSITGILEDSNGTLWVSTLKGLSSINLELTADNQPRIHSYTKVDGLQGNEFSRGAYIIRNNGHIVLGGQHGITEFNPLLVKNNPIAPQTVITHIDIPQNAQWSQPVSSLNNIVNRSECTIEKNQPTFTIHYVALNYLTSQKNQYAHKLEGLDDDWHYVGNTRKVTYNNLRPGTYTFYVKASNNDGVWNENPTILKITIRGSLWSSYFWLLLLFCLPALLLLFVLYLWQKRTTNLQHPMYIHQHSSATTESVELMAAAHRQSNYTHPRLGIMIGPDVTDTERAFLEEAIQQVLSNISDEHYGVQAFSQDFDMSRRNLLRKIKHITNLSITEFIKRIRLSEAKQLLLDEKLNISEVAYKVGFNDPKYFSQCFKKRYGQLPSKLKDETSNT